ncbi:hypothetical protein M514_01080 [Trichuris suis]|uniref:Kunitz/Bovine pancreatic trypsin inhibitor domain protein n=1 Tax=Trichuris suis TaxID=68888 RepID=A0A085MXE4_9BILA|nr:hypothetical protein M513_01080 [Trichuris suis]KFD61890.1 hypothetical protein M514_01080 [Trichuris suis]
MWRTALHLLFACHLYLQCYATDDICNLPVSQGPCDEILMRWYYNRGTKQCEEFVYGGCEGNENNFLTKEQCEATCTSSGNGGQGSSPPPLPTSKDPPVTRCHLPMDQGPCKAILPRWYYNKKTRQCEKFIYGGCYGNENNFLTKEMCEAKCHRPTPPPPKTEPYPPGSSCSDFPRLWFFNVEKRKCQLNCELCHLKPELCYRSKLECLQNSSPKDVICLSLPEGFHILNPKKKCSRYYFSCLDGIFTNHSCPEEYRFDVSTNVCRPPEYVAACQSLMFSQGIWN